MTFVNTRILSLLIFLGCCFVVNAQIQDTSLIELHGKPFFFNVIKSKNGDIYAGTSEGVVQLQGSKMDWINNRSGYVTLNAKEQLDIDSNGIRYKNQYDYLHLLPFPNELRTTFWAGNKTNFYIVAGGKIYIYSIMPYRYEFRNHSIRTISKNFVGTYSGIYYKGKRISQPKFCDGYIREYNNKAFVCYSNISIYDMSVGDSLVDVPLKEPAVFEKERISDVYFSKPFNKYFIATSSSLISIDTVLNHSEVIYAEQKPNQEIVLIGQDRSNFLFAAGNQLLTYVSKNSQTQKLFELSDQIKDGVITKSNYYILTNTGLYAYRTNDKVEKLIDLTKAHTLLMINESEMIIGTDIGLYIYNINSNQLTVLIKGVEFNRRALYFDNNQIFAGSVNGLYILETNKLNELIDINQNEAGKKNTLPNYIISALAVLTTLSLFLFFIWWKTRKKMIGVIKHSQELTSAISQEAELKLDKKQIESFILEQIQTVTLKAIKEHFNISTRSLYAILDPEKPGAIIQRIRLELVLELRKKRISAKEIANQTGLSESYIRQIWKEKA